MARGTRVRLVELVLTASFRPERHGRLLLTEVLPAVLPLEGSDAAVAAWARLVELQASYQATGFVDTWGFWSAVRALHSELSSGPLAPMERWNILWALSASPWRGMGADGGPHGEPRYTDEQLRSHWDSWARQAGPSGAFRGEWGLVDWAWQRFQLGLGAEEAYRESLAARHW